VIGVFLTLLGAGVILDGDWTWRGSVLIAFGGWCLWRASEPVRGEGKPST
jgi:hypothetical protein